MSEVLAEIQAGYVQRAQMALQASAKPLERAARPKATRTYTGAALERRRAWARLQKERYARIMEIVNAEYGG